MTCPLRICFLILASTLFVACGGDDTAATATGAGGGAGGAAGAGSGAPADGSSGAGASGGAGSANQGGAAGGLAGNAGASGANNGGAGIGADAALVDRAMDASASDGTFLDASDAPAVDASSDTVKVTVTFVGDGQGTLTGGGAPCTGKTCQYTVARSASLTLIATPRDSLHRLVSWSSPCSTSGSCTVSAPADVTLTVRFELVNNVVFVSAAKATTAQIRTRDAANKLCSDWATAADLHNKQWVAWRADTGSGSVGALGSSRGWVNRAGRPVADTQSALATLLTNPILFDETGARSTASAWTGSNLDGTVSGSSGNCENWQSSDSLKLASGGNAADSVYWSAGNGLPCHSSNSLYCLGTDSSTALGTLPIVTGRIAFLSKGLFSPNTGRPAADKICSDEAAAVGLAGPFFAALSLGQSSYSVRWDLGPPTWVRRDLQLLFADALDMAVGKGLTAINVHADGTAAPNPPISRDVWVGSVGSTCGDWSVDTGSIPTQSYTQTAFSNVVTTTPCSRAGRVFCLGQ